MQIPPGDNGWDCSFTGATPVCVTIPLGEGSILGFESSSAWKAPQYPTGGFTMLTASSPKTEGRFALQIGGGGYNEITSATFSTSILQGVTSEMGLDVYIPAGQPNPYWLGAVQLYADCPSANICHMYIGQAELTGLPQGVFSTVAFKLPAAVVTAMQGSHADFDLRIATNINNAGHPLVLDNLRFLPDRP